MTKEDKMLLIKDLSSRLPYAVHVQHISGVSGILRNISIFHKYDENDNIYDAICYTDLFKDECSIGIEHFKPYLFPILSMPEEATREFSKTLDWVETTHGYSKSEMSWDTFDCVNKHHIDYRGLIEKGLAIDATGLNIY